MIESDKIHKILYGGDYNPEQWPEETWQDDMRLLKKAHIDIVTLNVFSWALLQPDEYTYNFSMLDKIMNLVRDNGLKVCLATSTAAVPAWMARLHPDVCRTSHIGIHKKFGRRHNFCPNSPTYKKYSAVLASKLAQRYKGYSNIVAWHICNEYGGLCYCDNCEKAFRQWLKNKYKTIENLNKAWDTNFWSHTFYDWDDIVVPDCRTEEFEKNGVKSVYQQISIDYLRFNSDSLLACMKAEKETLKKETPDIPVTTNMMGIYKQLNYKDFADAEDFVSWDNYPEYGEEPVDIAMRHDLMRGIKGGKSFALMEQTPSVNNWHVYGRLKRPGVMRLWSYQAVAHGADTVMFYQMKRSVGACEKYHGAVIDHAGTSTTRVFREVSELGRELEYKIKDLTLGGSCASDIAILFDWENWWAAEFSAGPTTLINYVQEIKAYYKALFKMHYSIDFITVSDNLEKYKLVIAPMLYMVKSGYDDKLKEYVKNGGALISSYFSGYVNENDIVTTGGYPGKLRDLLGIWVEESDAIPEGESNSFIYDGLNHDKTGTEYPASILCDLMHTENAISLTSYKKDFYSGMPAITVNHYGNGTAIYVGTHSSETFYKEFLGDICDSCHITQLIKIDSGDIEVTERRNANGAFLFILNHGTKEAGIAIDRDCRDIISDIEYKKGDIINIDRTDIAVLYNKMQESL